MMPMDPKQQEKVWSRVMRVANTMADEAALDGTQGAVPDATQGAASENPQNIASDATQGTVPDTTQEAAIADTLSEETLRELIADEWNDCATYRRLASMRRGSCRQAFLKMAQEEACHAKKLGAMVFLKTGKRVCPECGTPDCITCFSETLRERYAEELESSKRYEALAEQAAERACTFRSIAEDECRHAHTIYCILQNTL